MNKKSVQKYSIAILALLLIQTFSSISMGYSQNSYLRSSYMAPKGERYSRPDIIDASGSLGIKKTNILNGISISHPFWNLGMFTLNTISNVIMIYDAPMYARSLFISIKVTSFEPVERDLDVKIKTHDSNNFTTLKNYRIVEGVNNPDIKAFFDTPIRIKEIEITYKSFFKHEIEITDAYCEVFIPDINIDLKPNDGKAVDSPRRYIPDFSINYSYNNYNLSVQTMSLKLSNSNFSRNDFIYDDQDKSNFINYINQCLDSLSSGLYYIPINVSLMDSYNTNFSKQFIFRIDRKPPAVQDLTTSKDLASGKLVFNVTARDFSVKELTRYSIKFSANSRTQENQSTLMHWDNNEIIIPFNIDRLFPYHMPSGVLTVTACFTDSHDNEINIYEVYTVDRTIPTISIETNFPYSNGTMFVSNLQQFNITCTSSKPVDIESDPWEFKLFKDNALVHTYLSPDGQYFSPYNLQPGFYRLHVNVVDFYGLKNSSYYSIWIDSQGPEFTSVNAPSSHGPIPRISISVHELILKDLYYMTNLTGSDIFEVPSFSESELEGTGDVDHHFSFLLNETIWNMMEHSDTVNIIIVAEDLFKNTTENVIIRRDDVAPTITNIYLNGTKRPLTLPTFYISNYGATSWRIKFECNKEVDQTASYLKFINGIELSKLDDPTDNKSITFLINNNDLPYGPQNAFLMELNIVGSNGVSLFENIWLNLIRSAPEIAFLPFTNGTFKISSSLPLERISIVIENADEFVFEEIFQNKIFDLTSYMPIDDGSKTIYITIRDLSGFNTSLIQSIIVDRECPDFVLMQNGRLFDDNPYVNNWNNITYHCVNDTNNFAYPINFWLEITEPGKNGEHIVSAFLEDAAGNIRHKEFTLVYDSIKPQVTYLGNYYYGNQTPTLNFAVHDESPLEFSIRFKTTTHILNISESGIISIELDGWDGLSNGFNDFIITATDKAGNVYRDTIQIYKVSVPPQVVLKYPLEYSSYKSSKHPTFNVEFQSPTDVLCVLTIGNQTDNKTFYYNVNKNDGLLWNQPLPYWPYESRIEVTLTLIDEFNNSVEETWIMYRTDIPGFVRDNNLNFSNLFTGISWQVWIIMIVNIGFVLFICFRFKDELITRNAGNHLAALVSISLALMAVVSAIPSFYPGFLVPWATYWIPQLIIMQILVASVTAIIGLVLIGAIKWADAKRALKDLIDGFKKIQDSYEGTPSDQVSLIKDWVFEVNSTDFKMLSPKDLIRHYQLTGYSLGRPLVKLEDTMAKKIGKRSRGMLNFLAFLSKIAPLFVAIGMTIAFIAIILAIDSLLGYPIIRGLTGL